MTGKERLTCLLHKQPTDRIPWTTLVDDTTRSVMLREIRELPVLDFYRHIGCDIACFGNYGLPENLCVYGPCQCICPEVNITAETRSDGTRVQTTHTPWGILTATFMRGHPIKHPVETLADLRVLNAIWLHSRYEEVPGKLEATYARLLAALGKDGVFIWTLDPSPVQSLLEYDMGLVNFYNLLADHPKAVEELMAVMHTCRCQEYEICARRMPCEAVMPAENTSTTLISPALYERYSQPHIRDLVTIMHRHKKIVILHMCGLIRDLLPMIKATGADGVNALTPAPIGNTSIEEALNGLGEDILIWGAILDGSVFQTKNFSRAALERHLDRLLTPRARQAHVLLWAQADGILTPVKRFHNVKAWMNQHGIKP